MLIEIGRTGKLMRMLGSCTLALLLIGGSVWAADEAPAQKEQASKAEASSAEPTDWESWKAGTTVSNTASLQRGARNFAQYCMGCHSLKYVRWSRVGTDLNIPASELQELIPAGDTPASYVSTPMPSQDAENWFGKAPPDLSLMAPSAARTTSTGCSRPSTSIRP